MVIRYLRAKRAEWLLRRQMADAKARLMEAELAEVERDWAIQKDLDDESRWYSDLSDRGLMDERTHEQVQERAHKFYYENPWAHSIVSALRKYTVGRGFKVQIDDDQAQRTWDEWARERMFTLQIREAVERTFRDGESLQRRFEGAGLNGRRGPWPYHRFIRPGLLKDPESNHSFGIATDPKDSTIPARYYVVTEADKSQLLDGAPIPADEIWHMKINVDSEVKRGVTILKPIMWILPQLPQIMRNRLALHRIRTAVAMIRETKGGPTKMRSVQSAYQKERGQTLDTTRQQAIKPGTIWDMTQGVGIRFETPQLGAVDVQHDLRFFLLALCAGTDLAEFMVSADASNANYASTMVSESPAIRAIEDWQEFFDVHIEREVRWILRLILKDESLAANLRVSVTWPPIVHREFAEEAKAYALLQTSGILSKQTVQSNLGFDPDEERERIENELADEDKDGGQIGGQQWGHEPEYLAGEPVPAGR